MKTSKAKARKDLDKAVALTRSEIGDAIRTVDSGRSQVVDRAGAVVGKAGDVVDSAGDVVAKGRKKAGKTSRKTKRRAAKAQKRLTKSLPDLPSTDVVTKRSGGRGKTPLLLVLAGAAGAVAYKFLKGSK